jgi:hypothetical protein
MHKTPKTLNKSELFTVENTEEPQDVNKTNEIQSKRKAFIKLN